MNLIAAADKNWAIGKSGRELVDIPEDKKLFREETMGKVIVMGRKTFESLPGAAALSGRVNIVLTRNESFKPKNVLVFHSMEELLQELNKYSSEDIYIIGGGSVYSQFLEMCNVAHITRVDYDYDADTYFPDLDNMSEWKIKEKSEEKTYFDVVYEFVKYVKEEF